MWLCSIFTHASSSHETLPDRKQQDSIPMFSGTSIRWVPNGPHVYLSRRANSWEPWDSLIHPFLLSWVLPKYCPTPTIFVWIGKVPYSIFFFKLLCVYYLDVCSIRFYPMSQPRAVGITIPPVPSLRWDAAPNAARSGRSWRGRLVFAHGSWAPRSLAEKGRWRGSERDQEFGGKRTIHIYLQSIFYNWFTILKLAKLPKQVRRGHWLVLFIAGCCISSGKQLWNLWKCHSLKEYQGRFCHSKKLSTIIEFRQFDCLQRCPLVLNISTPRDIGKPWKTYL